MVTTEVDPQPKLSMKVLDGRLKVLEGVTHPEAEPADTSLLEDLLLGVCEALRCAGINTAARMAEELEETYLEGTTDAVLKRYPWMADYR